MDLLPKKYEDVFLSREQNSDAPVINEEYVTRFDGISPFLPLLIIYIKKKKKKKKKKNHPKQRKVC